MEEKRLHQSTSSLKNNSIFSKEDTSFDLVSDLLK